MTPINKSKFALQIGVSRQFIGKLLKQDPPVLDIITHNGKEHIDIDGVNTQYFLKSRGATVKPPPPKKEKKPKIKKPAAPKAPPEAKKIKVEPPPKPPQELTIHTPDPARQTNPLGNNGSPNNKEKHELDKNRIREVTEKYRIDNEKRRGELIPKNLIKKVFARFYSIDANQFKTLGIKVSPGISSLYNSSNTEKTKNILELIGKKSDRELKKEINKILNSGESERILQMNRILEDGTGIVLGAIHRESEKFLKNIEKLKER